jgi:hypothetical protein
MANITREIFEPIFADELQLLRTPACARCDAGNKQPLLPWLVGDRYEQTDERLAFIGKPHRGTPGVVLASGIIDPTSDVPGMWNGGWAYWSYTRDIAQRVFGPSAADFVCFTNIIKCTNTGDVDRTTSAMVQSCVVDLRVIWRELERLRARTMVFYTYALRGALNDVPLAVPGSLKEVTSADHRVRCGQKQLGWWHREFVTLWGDKARMLVVGHPERMDRSDYVSQVASWVRGEDGAA